MKKEDVIGKKACGVVVSTRANCYMKALDNYVGKVGIICDKWSDSFSIRFLDGKSWSYPIKRLAEAIKLAETSTSTPESFPEKWCLRVTKKNIELIGKWRSAGELSDSSIGGYVMYEGYTFKDIRGYFDFNKPKSCTEITTEQFKEHVLKETSKAVVKPTKFKKGDYIVYLDERGSPWLLKNHCYEHNGKCSRYFSTSKDSNYGSTSNSNVTYQSDLWRYATPEEIAEYNRIGKPYDVTTLVSKPAVKKWSVGSYVVFCKKIWHYKIGDIDIITEVPSSNEVMALKGDGAVDINREQEGTFKWFATKEEAEAFAKTLTKAEEKVELVVGKWYFVDDYGTTYKVKYNNYWKTCDYITLSNSYFGSGAFENPTNIKPLTDLSEIQKYLPDGHPDKVVVKEEFKVGDWLIGKTVNDGIAYKIVKIETDKFTIEHKGLPYVYNNPITNIYRKALPHEIPTSTTETTKAMTNEELLEELIIKKLGIFKASLVSLHK